jgi:hypothetical protein
MSQQMEFEEGARGYQSGYSAPGPQGRGADFDDHFAGFSGQKIGQVGGSAATAGQRLALAIVSLCLLVPLAGIIFGIGVGGMGGFLGVTCALIGMGFVCVAIIAVNAVFNAGRH